MISEEFYFRIQQWKAIEAHWNGLYQSFSEKLSNGLLAIVYEKIPWLSEQKKEKEIELEKIIETYIRKAWDCFEIAYHVFFHQKKVERFIEIPEPLTKEESRKELKERLTRFPEDAHEYLSKFHWDDFYRKKHYEGFILDVYKKLKEGLADNYAEYIQEFDGNCIRALDSEIYHICAEWFVNDVYALVPRGSRY